MSLFDSLAWDAFVEAHGDRSGQFLQSWKWGEYLREEEGERAFFRREWEANGEVWAVGQGVRRSIRPFGFYAYIPKGPIAKRDHQINDLFTDDRFASDIFLRVEPSRSDMFGGSAIRSTVSIQPKQTFLSDVRPVEADRLSLMHEKTRYNIRLAQKKGVKVQVGGELTDEVWEVFAKTAMRGQFRLHDRVHYERLLRTCAFLAVATHDDEVLAATIMIDFGKTRTYLHGASIEKKRGMMAPYALHAYLMEDAHGRGLHTYDWWGVAPLSAGANHPWAGISRFKRGFGGEEWESPGTFDVVRLPLSYGGYRWARLIHRLFNRSK